jgi:hypothetical protein
MNKKQIIIDAPEGKVIDMEYFNQTGNVRFIDENPKKIEFPKEWELKEGESYYIGDGCTISQWDIDLRNKKSQSNRNNIPTKTLAEQMLIFTQLITMRERYREIEKLNNPELGVIDWNNCKQRKYSICIINNNIVLDYFYESNKTFSFLLEKTRDEFANNFEDMILQCKDIL